jgi:hypothetical protein
MKSGSFSHQSKQWVVATSCRFKNGFATTLAWIDENGNCLFPEIFAGSTEESNNISRGAGEFNGVDKDVNFGGENVDIAIMEELDVDFDAYTESIYGKQDVDFVREMFLTGMDAFGITEFDIVYIFCNS